MASQPGTNKQISDHSIMHAFNKQAYLGQQFSFTLNSTPGSISEIPLFLLTNPAVAASAFPSGYQSLFLNLSRLVCVTAAQTAILRVYAGPTVTGAGSAQTPFNARTGSATASIAALATAPTVSANGILIDALSAAPGISDLSQFMAIIDPGKIILVTIQASSVGTIVNSKIAWFEL